MRLGAAWRTVGSDRTSQSSSLGPGRSIWASHAWFVSVVGVIAHLAKSHSNSDVEEELLETLSRFQPSLLATFLLS